MGKEEKKTVVEYLLQLGGKYRKQAVNNCTNPLAKTDNKIDALETAFEWSKSPEGFEYWNDYWNYLIDKAVKTKSNPATN